MSCKEPGCGRPIRSLGLCNMHYQRLYRLGSTSLPPREPRPMRLCEEPGCERPHVAGGLCRNHYQRLYSKGWTLTEAEQEQIARALDWVLDGEPLTTSTERRQHRELVV